jgi:hypothetical protein
MRSLAVLLALWLTGVGAAFAQQTSAGEGTAAALNWVRLAGAESCPDSSQVARRVEAHLGRRVFWSASDADESIEVVVARESRAWTLRMHVQSGDGRRGERQLRSDGPACAALIEDAIVAIAALIDPQHDPGATRIAPEVDDTLEAAFGAEPTDPDPDTLRAGGTRPSTARDPQPTPKALAAESPHSRGAARSDSVRLRGALGTIGALGRVPGIGAGIAAGLTLQLPDLWSVQLELMSLLPRTELAQDSTGRVTFTRSDARLRLCPLDLGSWLACAGGGVGIVTGSATGFVHSRRLSPTLGADLDVSTRYRLPLSADFSLTFGATLSVALRRPELVFRSERASGEPRELYSTPLLGGHLTAGVEIEL